MSARTPPPKTRKKSTAKKKAPPRSKDPLAEVKAFMSGGEKGLEMLGLTDPSLISSVPGYISTRSLALNKGLRVPGIPLGRFAEVSGEQHTGKSTFLDHLIAEVQSMGGHAHLIDSEAGRDAQYTRSIGVDVSCLICPQYEDGLWTIERVFSYIDRLATYYPEKDPERPVLLGIDTIAALPTLGDLERDAGDLQPGDAARVIHHGLRVTTQKVAKSRLAVVFINQVYENIGGFGFDKKKEYGGKGIGCASTIRLRLSRMGALKNSNEEVVGFISQAYVMKQKLSSATGSKVLFGILHGRGIDNSWTLFEVLKKEGYIHQSGRYWSLQLPGEAEPIRWAGKHFGLAEKLTADPRLYEHLLEVYATCQAA